MVAEDAQVGNLEARVDAVDALEAGLPLRVVDAADALGKRRASGELK